MDLYRKWWPSRVIERKSPSKPKVESRDDRSQGLVRNQPPLPQRPPRRKAEVPLKRKTEEMPLKQEEKESRDEKVENKDWCEESGAFSELSPLMANMLEAELQDLMETIKASLPENPAEGPEKLFVEKFKNVVGEDLKNTLGMNISARLLNVWNDNLYVKVVFSGVPARLELAAWVRARDLHQLRRVPAERAHAHTYTARARSYTHFDQLCGLGTDKCGEVDVKITPCYQIMKCPARLRTVYNVTDNNTNKHIKLNKQNETNNAKDKSEKNKQKNEPHNTTSQNQTTASEVLNKASVNKKTASEVLNNAVSSKTASEVLNKASPSQITASEVLNKASVSQKKASETQVNTDKSKTQQKINKVSPLKSKIPSDFDELDDHDILAMLSEGVVLDECSGSED